MNSTGAISKEAIPDHVSLCSLCHESRIVTHDTGNISCLCHDTGSISSLCQELFPCVMSDEY